MNTGQITRDSIFGNLLYNMAKNDKIINIVEIGTWTGMGSTKCIIDGLMERKTFYNFITIELYPEMYKVAKQNLSLYLNDNIKILNGTIIKFEDVFWFDHKTINFSTDAHARLYYNTDLNYIKNAVNVLDQLPTCIDLLILDGGEYTTYPEYNLLKGRTNIFALDDTRILKCSRIREELIKEKINILYDDINDRNGCGVYCKYV